MENIFVCDPEGTNISCGLLFFDCRFVKRELEKAKREAEDRWNFDFENERPIEGGRFHWVSGTASNQLLTEQPSTTPPVDHQSENNSLSPKPGTHSAGKSFI